MERKIEIAQALAERLKRGVPKQIVERAVAENGWFRASEIEAAVEAICCDMLEPQKLREWMAGYPTLPLKQAEDVLIIMAGNIPLVGFFDLLCVIMAGHNAYVKPSSKDRVLMEYVVSLLRECECDISIYLCECKSPSRVIATGGESAMRHFKSKYPTTPTLLRGSRHSIAVLSNRCGEAQMGLLSKDIYMYSGLGCRSVSMIFKPRGMSINTPPHDIHPKYRNNYIQNRALLVMNGVKFRDNGASLFVESEEISSALSVISVREYDSLYEVQRWIEDHHTELQCIVSDTMLHPRCVGLGLSQRPTLSDYADDADTMKFLMEV